MKYYKFFVETYLCGTDETFFAKFETDPSKDDLDKMLNQLIMDNAESYEYLLDLDYLLEDETENEMILDDYYYNASGFYEEITEEEYKKNFQKSIDNFQKLCYNKDNERRGNNEI